MKLEGIKYKHVSRKAERAIYFTYGASKIDLELLISLSILIISTGKLKHGKHPIMRKALQPRKNSQFLASFATLINNKWIEQHKYKNGHNYSLTNEGLAIIERYDLICYELVSTIPDTATPSDIINGSLN